VTDEESFLRALPLQIGTLGRRTTMLNEWLGWRGLVLFAVLTSACGGSESGSAVDAFPTEADAGVVDSSAPQVTDDAGSNDAREDAPLDADAATGCNAPANVAPAVVATSVGLALPSGTGGAIADGTYHLTAATYYRGTDAGPAGPPLTETWRTTIAFSGNTFALASRRNTGAEERISGATSTSGVALVFQEACPAPASRGPFEYTATGAELVAYFPNDGRALRFTKQ
jgi:hypothetical protein